jgi:predicted ATPase
MCREVEIEYLTTADIDRYLGLVFRGHEFPEEFPRLIHARTEGNALFMTDLIEYLKDRGIIQQKERGWIITEGLADIERNMPESVRSIVQRKIDQLQDNDRRLLVAASIQGFDFDSASVARVLNLDPAEVEEQLDGLERIHTFVRFVEERELPNRSVTLRYRFVHVLYQNALYASSRPTRRAQWSLAMAETLLDSYGERSSEIASNLAFLFETARDFARAADYSILAARNALQVFANKEAAALSRHALELLELLPPSPARTRNEIAAQMTLGVALSTLKGGYSAPEVEAAYGRAFELCEGLGEDASVFPALYGLWSVHTMRANYSRALELGERMLPIARRAQDPMLLTMTHNALGFLKPFMGDYAGAESDLEEALRWHNREIQETSFARFGVEPRTGSLAAEAWVCWALGFPDKSRQRLREAYEMTEQVKHSISVAAVMSWAASLALDMEEFGLAKQRAEASMAYAADHGVLQGLGHSQYSRGSALACLGEIGRGIEEIRNAMRLLDAIGCDLGRTIMLLRIAELSGLSGDFTRASEVLAEARAFATRTGEFYRASEFDRVEGNLLLLSIKPKEMIATSPEEDEVIEAAAQRFLSSMEIARSRQARSFELKTAIDLAVLRQSQGKIDEARATLEPLLNWFTEGFDTPLLMRAQSVFVQRS